MGASGGAANRWIAPLIYLLHVPEAALGPILWTLSLALVPVVLKLMRGFASAGLARLNRRRHLHPRT